jgi:hypothetical protein
LEVLWHSLGRLSNAVHHLVRRTTIIVQWCGLGSSVLLNVERGQFLD